MKGFICCLLLIIHLAGVFCSPRRVFLDRNCGGSLSLSQERNGVIKLLLTSNKTYAPYTDCHMSVVAKQHMRIGITFLDMDIMSFDSCSGDYLQIYDGIEITDTTFLFTSPHQQKTFCGSRQPAHLSSHHNNMTLRFVSDAYFSSKGFSLILTAFHTGRSCRDDEYRCSNSKCIHENLYCDGYDNCGDGSDICQISVYLIIGIVVTAFITLIAMIVLCSVLHYRLKKQYLEDYDNHFDAVSLGREYQGCPEANTGSTRTNTISVITRSLYGNNPVPGGNGNGNNHPRGTTEVNTVTRSWWVNQPLPF